MDQLNGYFHWGTSSLQTIYHWGASQIEQWKKVDQVTRSAISTQVEGANSRPQKLVGIIPIFTASKCRNLENQVAVVGNSVPLLCGHALATPLLNNDVYEIHIIADDLSSQKIIRPLCTPYGEPVFLATNGKWLTVTYRRDFYSAMVDIWNVENIKVSFQGALREKTYHFDDIRYHGSHRAKTYHLDRPLLLHGDEGFLLCHDTKEKQTILRIPLNEGSSSETALNIDTPALALDVNEENLVVATNKQLVFCKLTHLDTQTHHQFQRTLNTNKVRLTASNTALLSSPQGLWRFSPAADTLESLWNPSSGLMSFDINGDNMVAYCIRKGSQDLFSCNLTDPKESHSKTQTNTLTQVEWFDLVLQNNSLWITLPQSLQHMPYSRIYL